MLSRAFLSILALLALAACETTPPAAPPQPPVQPRDEPPAHVVFFDKGGMQINATGIATIRQAAVEARKPGVKAVEITGHTDRAGSDQLNNALSLRRARVVRERLIREGVPAALITARALGESKPFMQTEDGIGQPENRRAEITIVR
jgi:outer membrane protein OmpA-like peptidoglycan-associated protein